MTAQRIPKGWANRRLLRAAAKRERKRRNDEFWRAFVEEQERRWVAEHATQIGTAAYLASYRIGAGLMDPHDAIRRGALA